MVALVQHLDLLRQLVVDWLHLGRPPELRHFRINAIASRQPPAGMEVVRNVIPDTSNVPLIPVAQTLGF
ncbi:uncharacterized protein TRAVEDRAFT_33735 [Trametes versicolor FP-101664 SS1]|uniref:uncharacterized protein n=1 Tax=Trametes versicolor (strain FP-101664) TaxID=717944 RepID=UPI0004621B5D|nr:uncharacterized protein TRAVEDRAFT_33735 [Trametes versicolor FP-101664 SS1]EIW65040.1 hypothetical protein TRAVEDRAFT_33735 [Trametes versicolor FP-101664 SS1]